MFGLMFLGALLANIFFTAIIFGVVYYFYKKNEDKIKYTIIDIQMKINEISNTIDEVVTVTNNITDKVEDLEPAIGDINNTVNSVNTVIEEPKKKLDKFPF